MSLPLAAVGLITTVLSTGAQVYGQMEQQKMQEQRRAEELAAATAANTANYDQINLRRQQEREAAGQQQFENRVDALSATERFKVSADEAGVAGNSVEASLRSLYGKEARFNDSVAYNFDITSSNLEQQAIGVQNQTQSAFNSATVVEPIDWFGAIGGLARGGMDAYMTDLKVGRAGGRTLFS